MIKYIDEAHEIRGVTLDFSKTFDDEWHEVKIKDDLFDKAWKSFLVERVVWKSFLVERIADSSKWQMFIFTILC